MSGQKRAYAVMLCACIVLGLFFPTLYAALTMGHFCCGNGCKVCESLEKTEALLRAFALFALALTVCRGAVRFPRAACVAFAAGAAGSVTPVRRKVRLND